MKQFARSFLLSAFVLAGSLSGWAQISTIESREALLEKAERLNVAPADTAVKDRFAAVPDPFNRSEVQSGKMATGNLATGTTPEAGSGTQRQASVSDQAALLAISEKIRPSGVMRFGDEILLVFGERRLRVGDFISVQHLGRTYKVKIAKADTSGFMLRLNDETISKRIQ